MNAAMQFTITCPSCNKVTKTESDSIPDKIRCQDCNHEFSVPKKLHLDDSALTENPKLSLAEASISEMVKELSRRGHMAVLTQLNNQSQPERSSELSMLGLLESSVMAKEPLGIRHYLTESIKQENLEEIYRLMLRLLEQRNANVVHSLELAPGTKPTKTPSQNKSTKSGLLKDPIVSSNQEMREEIVTDQGLQPAQVLKEFSLKGDTLGVMTLQDFKEKYRRSSTVCNRVLPLCSDERPGFAFHELLGEEWHHMAGIIHGRVELPSENLSPTIAGVKTDYLIYQFLDEKLFQITGVFNTDSFHEVAHALRKKFGPAISEGEENRKLLWWTLDCSIELQFGRLRPREPAIVRYYHDDLLEEASGRKKRLVKDI